MGSDGQVFFATLAMLATLATLAYVLVMAVRHARVRGLMIAISLWLLSFAAGWLLWLLHVSEVYSIPPDVPGQARFGVMAMLLPLIAGVVYWITQEIAEK